MNVPLLRCLAALLLLLALTGGQAQDESQVREVPLIAYPETPWFPYPAAIRELVSAHGTAFLYVHDGVVLIHMQPNGAMIPAGTVLEAWLVDVGQLIWWIEEYSNESAQDQLFGPSFGDPVLDVLISAAPFSRSVGLLSEDETGNWSLETHLPNTVLYPYDFVLITAESDGNSGEWDPRPGAPIFYGVVRDSAWGTAIERLGMVGPIEIPALREPIAVPLERTAFAAAAGLGEITGQATLYATPRYGTDTRRVDFTIRLNDSRGVSRVAPPGENRPIECLILEGWLVDAGLLGGVGVSNASDGDEAWGVPFPRWASELRLVAAVEAAPFALSTGVAADHGDGTLSASMHFPGYNFDPFDTFMVTLESDCYGHDPRPGTPVLSGRIGG